MKRWKRTPEQLTQTANALRQDVIRMLIAAGSGHTAGSLGMADIFSALYFGELHYDPKKPLHKNRDFLFLSNGHICPILYATLAEAGYFPKKELMTLRKLGSRLQGHPQVGALPGIENSGGPLGQGASQAVGCALALLRDKRKNRVYCLCGDGELDEGQIWEAAMFAAHHKLENLTFIIDRNDIQIDGRTRDVMDTGDVAEKFRAFGWNAITINGHDFPEIMKALAVARAKKGKPTVIVAKTTPGKGIKAFENDYRWHGKAPTPEEGETALQELENTKKIRGGKS